MKLKKKRLGRVALLPTLLTLGNLLCGLGAINYTLKGNYEAAAWLILIGMILFDALDGKIARLTKSATKFGAQLDSLVDVVSFGVAPALLVNAIITQGNHHLISSRFTLLLCAFFVVCAVLRLARFNIETATPDTDSHEYFPGLPTPGAAGLVATMIILRYDLAKDYGNPGTLFIFQALPFIILVLSALMITRLRYIHVLNVISKTSYPFIRVIEIVLLALLVALKPELILCAAFLLYALSGPFLYIKSRLIRKASVLGPVVEEQPASYEDADEESIF